MKYIMLVCGCNSEGWNGTAAERFAAVTEAFLEIAAPGEQSAPVLP